MDRGAGGRHRKTIRVAESREAAPTRRTGPLPSARERVPCGSCIAGESPWGRQSLIGRDETGEGSAAPPFGRKPEPQAQPQVKEVVPKHGGEARPADPWSPSCRHLDSPVRDLGDGRLAFDLADEVPFASESARLPNRAERVLAPLAEALLRNPDVRITLVGHTDDRGPAEYNRRLSLSRALAVAAYLNRQGVAEERVSSQGMGKDVPLPEEDGTTRARQRRVEVIIEPIAR